MIACFDGGRQQCEGYLKDAHISDTDLTVCLISPLPPPYGGIAHWTALVHRYAAASKTVRFFQVDTAPRWRAVYDRAIVKRMIGAGLQFVRDYVVFLLKLLKRPDVVHLTTSGDLAALRDVAVCATARLCRVPLVYHIRFGRVPEIALANTYEWRIMATAMRMSGVVISITSATTETLLRYLPGIHVEQIPNPIDCSELPPPVENRISDRTVLFLGWILPTKGVEELVRAWSELASEGWNLLLVGPGEMAYQQKLLQRYNPKNLRFVGELEHDEAMRLMAQCDLFVLPSYTEGFPNVILEAMALGKPIIATSVGAIPDMLSNDCGLVVEPKNVEALRKTLIELIHDEPLRYKLGAAARKKVMQEYAIEVVFARYVQIWRRLTQSREGGKDVF